VGLYIPDFETNLDKKKKEEDARKKKRGRSSRHAGKGGDGKNKGAPFLEWEQGQELFTLKTSWTGIKVILEGVASCSFGKRKASK